MKKINLKNKIMLAILAGNMLCMGSAFATTYYGTATGGMMTTEPPYEDTPEFSQNKTLDISVGEYTNDTFIAATDPGLWRDGKNNTINITDGTFTGCEISGGHIMTSVSEHKINIMGGLFVSTNIYTGQCECSWIYDNTINISDGTFNDSNLYVGYTWVEARDVKNNILNISGGIFNGTSLYGVYDVSYRKYEGENNTLNIIKQKKSWHI